MMEEIKVMQKLKGVLILSALKIQLCGRRKIPLGIVIAV